MRFNKLGFNSLLVSVLLIALPVQAADNQGQFALRGVGLINCGLFIQEHAAKRDVYLAMSAWMDGYISGINQYAADTYDLLSFESTELIMMIVERHCHKNPQDPVFGVLDSIVKKLRAERIETASDKITIRVGERDARHYLELLKRVRVRLRQLGFYDGGDSDEFSPQLSEAIKKFQQSIDYEPTGFPDQMTLWRLLRSD